MLRDDWLLFPRHAVACAVAVVAGGVALPALAQNTTSAIAGRVLGADGRGVAAATVTITHQPSGTTVTATTDGEGRYAARGLRTGGPYTITFQRGNDIDRRSDIDLALAETLTLNGLLGVSAQTVTVTGRGSNERFNSSNMGGTTALGSREVGALPSIQRSLQDLARLDPRVSQTDKERGEISALGQNSRFNSITVDGVSIADTFGLESNNLPMIKQPISMDAIAAVQINVSNFDVTQKGYTGANINAVTKSGTNDFKGSVFYVFRNQDLAGNRINLSTGATTPTIRFKDTTMGFTLGGPIVQDKLFFFAAYEELTSSPVRAAPSFGPVGSALTNVGITPAQITALQTTARSTYGFDAGSFDVPSDTILSVKDLVLKLDWNISDNHRASLRYTKTEETNPIFPANSGTVLSLNSHWYDQVKANESVVAQWLADWSATLSTELKVSLRNYESVPITRANLPQVTLIFTGPPPAGTTGTTRSLLFGTDQFRHFNQLETETLDTYFGTTWNLGDHEIKFGADLTRNEIYNAFVNNSKGVYVFSGADPVALFTAGVPTSYTLRVPLAGRTLADGAADWTLGNLGLFLQDTWRVNDSLSLMFGVRLDKTSVGDKPIRNNAFISAFGLDNTTTLDGKSLLQPRLGFNLNLTPKEGGLRRQVRGGVGLFEGGSANVWLTNPFQNTGVQNVSFTCNSTGGSLCPSDLRFTPDVTRQPTITGSIPAAAVDLLASNTRQPSVWKLNLAFDAELPWAGLVAGIDWVHTKVNSSLNYRHLNLGAATRTAATDGRPMFYNAAGLGAACWTGADALLGTCGGRFRAGANAAFTDVLIAEETTGGKGDAVTLSLNGSWTPAFRWGLAYTRTTSTEVSPLTSSTAISNWNGRAVFDPNEAVVARSPYEVRDRIGANFTFAKAFVGNYRTTVGMVYEGKRGKPYSWTMRNDLNGDGIAGNDLMYIPRGPGSGEVEFFGATPELRASNEARFWSVVNSWPELSAAKGGVIARNSASAPWVNNWDLRISQEVPGLWNKHKGSVTFDVLNFGNMLNNRWGRIEEVGFNGGNLGGGLNRGGNARSFVNFAGLTADGRYIYNTQNFVEDFVLKQDRLESQWQLQVTLRYEF
jgi:hypothetical protein